MNNFAEVFETIQNQFHDVGRAISKAFGVFSESELRRMHYLCSKGYSLPQAKIVVKIENKYPVTFEELKQFNEIFSGEGK